MFVFNFKNSLSEGGNHEELLNGGVHVADATKVLETNIAGGGLLILFGNDIPVIISLGSPFAILKNWQDKVNDLLQVLGSSFAELSKQFECILSGVL